MVENNKEREVLLGLKRERAGEEGEKEGKKGRIIEEGNAMGEESNTLMGATIDAESAGLSMQPCRAQ